jgi:hypothetical protein
MAFHWTVGQVCNEPEVVAAGNVRARIRCDGGHVGAWRGRPVAPVIVMAGDEFSTLAFSQTLLSEPSFDQ